MKTFKLILVLLLSLFPVIQAPAATSPTFDPVFALVEALRRGEDVKVEVRVGATTFGVYREESEDITKEVYDSLLIGKSIRSTRLEFRHDGLAVVNELTRNLSAGQALQSGKNSGQPKSWFKDVSTRVGSYPLASWSEFLKAGFAHGLVACDTFREKDFTLINLFFGGVGPKRVSLGSGSLELSDGFYEYMKVSDRFKPSTGSDGFVVIVHDPHSSVTGALQLVPGLKALTSVNAKLGFVFLVEGEYDRAQGRRIDLGKLGETFDRLQNQTRAEGLAYDLLSRYMIDSPTAYRLLYDRKLEAFAIDDLEHLGLSSPNEALVDHIKIAEAVRDFYRAIEKEDALNSPGNRSAKESIQRTLGVVAAYANAGLEGANDQTLVEYYKNLSELLNNATDLGKKIMQASPGIQLGPIVDELTIQAKACDRERREYSEGINRNATMSKYIAEYARQSGRRVPIAFIGNFHTYGITDYLRKQNIGFVVVEPHFGYTSREELARFNEMLYSDTRPRLLQTLQGNHKLGVRPSDQEITKYYAPYLDGRLRQFTKQDDALKRQLASLPTSGFNYQHFSEIRRQNPSLMVAAVEVGDGGDGSKLPPGFDGAFAFYDPPGGPNPNGRFVVVDRNDDAWRAQGRYRYLKEAFLVLSSSESRKEGKSTFWYDRESNQWFAGLYRPETKRLYFFEGSDKVTGILGQVAALKPAKGQDTSVRIVITELIRLLIDEDRNNG